jgi:hypothetical protein
VPTGSAIPNAGERIGLEFLLKLGIRSDLLEPSTNASGKLVGKLSFLETPNLLK